MSARQRNTRQIPAATLRRVNVVGPAFKAGLIGGTGISLLWLIFQITAPPLKTFLIPPAAIIVWLVTGIGAAMLTENSAASSRAGLIAGLVSGTVSGIAAMIIAAFGSSFVRTGEGFSAQFSGAQLSTMAEKGLTEALVMLFGGIMAALFACGIGGMVAAGLLGWLGGWLYPRLNK